MTRIKDPRKYSHSLFQILVSLDTISDWPWWVSWQHFYSWSLPTKKLQATVPTSLKASHTLQYSCIVNLQKNRCVRKKLKSSDLCLWLKSATITIGLANILPNDIRSILSALSLIYEGKARINPSYRETIRWCASALYMRARLKYISIGTCNITFLIFLNVLSLTKP